MPEQSHQGIEAVGRRVGLPGFTTVAVHLLTLLPLVYAEILTWQEYLRLTVITAGLGYFWWQHRTRDAGESERKGRITTMLIALCFMFIITQFDPAGGGRGELASTRPLNVAFLTCTVLILGAFGGFLLSGRSWGRLALPDWIVIGTVLLVLGISTGSRLFFEGDFSWTSSVKLLFYAVIWFLITRWLPSEPGAERRLLVWMPGVFAVVCLVGGVRVGSAFYYYRTGADAQKRGVYGEALRHYGEAKRIGHALGLNTLAEASLFGEAKVFYEQGDLAAAADVLSMEEGFVQSIQPETWEGPAGGMLYTNIGCWKDLNFYEGEVEIRISAWGRPAVNVWPRMKVVLDGRVLGEADVVTREARPYDFVTGVSLGRQRLEIFFTNDYFDPPENRDLWVGRAEIRYKEIAWR